MPNTPLTSARYPASSAAPNINQDIQNLGLDLEDSTFAGPFASTTARDTAFSNWVALGNTMRDGLHCTVTGVGDQVYLGSNWRLMSSGAQWGTIPVTITSANNATGTLTYPFPFANAPVVMLTYVSLTAGSDLWPDLTTNPTTTNFGWRVRERAGSISNYTGTLHWLALPT